MRGYERLRSYQERVRVPRSARSHRRGWRKPKNSNRNARRSLRRNVDDGRYENLDLLLHCYEHCDECGSMISRDNPSHISKQHSLSCSLHPDNIVGAEPSLEPAKVLEYN